MVFLFIDVYGILLFYLFYIVYCTCCFLVIFIDIYIYTRVHYYFVKCNFICLLYLLLFILFAYVVRRRIIIYLSKEDNLFYGFKTNLMLMKLYFLNLYFVYIIKHLFINNNNATIVSICKSNNRGETRQK